MSLKKLLYLAILLSLACCNSGPTQPIGATYKPSTDLKSPGSAKSTPLGLVERLPAISSLEGLGMTQVTLSCSQLNGSTAANSVCVPQVTFQAKDMLNDPSADSFSDAYLISLCPVGGNGACTQLSTKSNHVYFYASLYNNQVATAKACVYQDRAPQGATSTDTFGGLPLFCGPSLSSKPSPAGNSAPNANVMTGLSQIVSLEANLDQTLRATYRGLVPGVQACTADSSSIYCSDPNISNIAGLVAMGEQYFVDHSLDALQQQQDSANATATATNTDTSLYTAPIDAAANAAAQGPGLVDAPAEQGKGFGLSGTSSPVPLPTQSPSTLTTAMGALMVAGAGIAALSGVYMVVKFVQYLWHVKFFPERRIDRASKALSKVQSLRNPLPADIARAEERLATKKKTMAEAEEKSSADAKGFKKGIYGVLIGGAVAGVAIGVANGTASTSLLDTTSLTGSLNQGIATAYGIFQQEETAWQNLTTVMSQ